MQTCTQTLDLLYHSTDTTLVSDSLDEREQLLKHYANITHKKILCFVHHSAGKDSQCAMILALKYFKPEQIIVLHANLTEEVEHEGVIEHIERYLPVGVRFEVVKNPYRNLLDGVLLRGKWMSSRARYCTSDYKVAQLDKAVRRICKELECDTAISTMGLRASESKMRAMKNPLWINKRLTTKSRLVIDWLPCHDLGYQDTFDMIEASGQVAHPAYGHRGDKFTRLSCVLCIFSDKKSLEHAANDYPHIYNSYVAIERVIEHDVFCKQVKKQPVGVSIAEKAGVPVDETLVQKLIQQMTLRREKLLTEKLAKNIAKEATKKAKVSCKVVATNQLSLYV